jgi:hypothetical protein
MKYSDIIGLNDYFEPFYDITHEHESYWMTFIPNDKFNDIMQLVPPGKSNYRFNEKTYR